MLFGDVRHFPSPFGLTAFQTARVWPGEGAVTSMPRRAPRKTSEMVLGEAFRETPVFTGLPDCAARTTGWTRSVRTPWRPISGPATARAPVPERAGGRARGARRRLVCTPACGKLRLCPKAVSASPHRRPACHDLAGGRVRQRNGYRRVPGRALYDACDGSPRDVLTTRCPPPIGALSSWRRAGYRTPTGVTGSTPRAPVVRPARGPAANQARPVHARADHALVPPDALGRAAGAAGENAAGHRPPCWSRRTLRCTASDDDVAAAVPAAAEPCCSRTLTRHWRAKLRWPRIPLLAITLADRVRDRVVEVETAARRPADPHLARRHQHRQRLRRPARRRPAASTLGKTPLTRGWRVVSSSRQPGPTS